jgi:hypothetical protein
LWNVLKNEFCEFWIGTTSSWKLKKCFAVNTICEKFGPSCLGKIQSLCQFCSSATQLHQSCQKWWNCQLLNCNMISVLFTKSILNLEKINLRQGAHLCKNLCRNSVLEAPSIWIFKFLNTTLQDRLTFFIQKSNNFVVGLNIPNKRFYVLNQKLSWDWFNQPFNPIQIFCINQFLAFTGLPFWQTLSDFTIPI